MSRPKRLQGVSYLGPAQYFITLCTLRRTRVFVDDAAVTRARVEFQRTAVAEGFAILAYCFMPDHLHLLVEGLRHDSDLRRLVKLAKQRSGVVYASDHYTGLWQEGYYERVLRQTDDAMSVARYILENPVRAGLVRNAQDYPFLGSDRWTIEQLIDSLDK